MPRIPEQIVLITQRLQGHPSRWKRWLATGAGVLVLIASFFLGLVMLILALGVATVVALFIGTRIWWLRRRLRGGQSQTGESVSRRNYGNVIEGESRDVTHRDN